MWGRVGLPSGGSPIPGTMLSPRNLTCLHNRRAIAASDGSLSPRQHLNRFRRSLASARRDSSPIFDLKYAAGRVTEFAMSRQGSDLGTKRSIDATLPAGTVDQRIDWATVLANNLETGCELEFPVYDPDTGIRRVAVHVGSLERVSVPAGSFDAYRLLIESKRPGGQNSIRYSRAGMPRASWSVKSFRTARLPTLLK
jgi:hypothetical protein